MGKTSSSEPKSYPSVPNGKYVLGAITAAILKTFIYVTPQCLG